MILKLPAYLAGFSSRSDNSAGVRFSTQELIGADFSKLQELNGKFGVLVFRENEMQDEDIPKEDAEEKKTPSRRLRAVLHVRYKQLPITQDFEAWYRVEMERIITNEKSKIDS